MNIAFYNLFGELKNAEQETLVRLQYCFNKQGHSLIEVNKFGIVTSKGQYFNKHIEECNVDFMFTYNTLLSGNISVFPNVFSVFCHWAPLGFVSNYQSLLTIKFLNSFEHFASTYEREIFKNINNLTNEDIPFVGSSVPIDFAQSAKLQNNRKLFYVGINFERVSSNMRYGELLLSLDKSNKIEIYGPKKVYGRTNLWTGFDSYMGEIPFDGKSIIEKINQAGICLAINSTMHNDINGVSNRTYEGAAAGALIISDDNSFVKKYFGDSVFYLNKNNTEKESADSILKIVEWANNNPTEAYEMAKESNRIFRQELSLDSMVNSLIESTTTVIRKSKDLNLQTDLIDIIAFVDQKIDLLNILEQLSSQYYQNYNLIIVTDSKLYEEIKETIPYHSTFIQKDENYKGKSFLNATNILQGDYFMFIDKNSTLHNRHISKILQTIKNSDSLFAYSGCYIKNGYKYEILNNEPILRDEFLSFTNLFEKSNYYHDMHLFFIETIFSRTSCIFSKKILDYINANEISIVSDAVHYYLACCSMIKTNKIGRFSYTITTGYNAPSYLYIHKNLFPSRNNWLSWKRSSKSFIKEMNEIFFKYSFELTPNYKLYREKLYEILVIDFLQNHQLYKILLNILTIQKRKKYANFNDRVFFYCQKYHILKKFMEHKIKKNI